MVAIRAAGVPQEKSGAVSKSERANRYSAAEVHALKARDNVTNWKYLAHIYIVIAAALAAGIWAWSAATAGVQSWWVSAPVLALAIIAIGAAQHQFGGAIHEGTHYMLFAGRKLNELVSDWLAAYPIYTTTYHFRLHHLAHHQFVNDPERDPDISQLHDSDHWLDFPITHVEVAWKLLKQLWLPNLFRYTITRARYSALGAAQNPYADPNHPGSARPLRAGILFAVGAPAICIPLVYYGQTLAVAIVLPALWALVVAILARLPDDSYPTTRLAPVRPLRQMAIERITYMALLYGALSTVELAGWGLAWTYFGLLWVLPLFTTFPLFMILRQWVQHGNADRGRYTNTRVFLVGPLMRWAVFPWGMDYHLPHHMMASVPHYNLPKLHEALLRDPEYAQKGVIVEGFFGGDSSEGTPTAFSVLGPEHAPKTKEAIYVDNAAIEYADIADAAAIAREVEASLRRPN